MLQIKRVYDAPAQGDGIRVLVDRVWPRGLTKEEAHVDEWRRDLAPSDRLRKWFGHDPARWDEFRRRYRQELVAAGAWQDLMALGERARNEDVTLLFGARDERHNQAVALRELLEDR